MLNKHKTSPKILKHLFFIVFICYNFTGYSQKTEKIKGSRNVILKQTYVDDFNTVIVGDKFEVDLVYNSKTSVQIEADDNLHEVIKFQVTDSTLTFDETIRITSKKKLKITVNYGDNLKTIEVRDDAQINSITALELNNVTLITNNDTEANLTINTKVFNFKSSGKTKSNLNITADSTAIELSNNSKSQLFLNTKTVKYTLYQRANATIAGLTENATIVLNNNSKYNSKAFDIKNAIVTVEDSSDLTVKATEAISISASGDSEIYLYGSPKITIEKFEDAAKLQKKKL